MSNDRYLYCVAYPSSRMPGFLCVNYVRDTKEAAQQLAFGPGRTGFVLAYAASECPIEGQYLDFRKLEAAGLI
ncbi:MAG: hypothetical protein CMI02_15125 [Oceanospirillaceae bacterium]|nr:hypothetical protein [Oceanospirillaceae bacterium]